MIKRKLCITTILLLITSNAFAFDKFEELRGSWWVSNYDKDKKVSFLNMTGKEVHLEFLDNKKISSNSGTLKNMGVEFNNNTFTFGRLFKNEIRYNKYIYQLYPTKELINSLICYEIKPIKITAGFYNKRDRYKICREERKYSDRTY
ncbi:MAG: hypothetical protein WC141_09930 [Arcobacteraceae bacterium]